MQGKIETRVGIFILAAIGIFMYMGFQIGAFRFDRSRYSHYTTFFKDISGLNRKGEVKIAGVKVGWVESVKHIENDIVQVRAEIMVLKEYTLYQNAHAIVRQEGLLGPKYLEIVPGDPLLATVPHGGILTQPSVAPVAMDELLQRFKKIATNVESITDALKDSIGGQAGTEQLRSIFDNFNVASEKLASFSTVLERSFSRNEDSIDAFLAIGENVRRVADKLEQDMLPAFQESIEKISDVFDRDFNRVADKLSQTADALQEAALQAQESFTHVASVTDKVDQGKGLLGKLINEDETYRDLKITVQGLKNYFGKVNTLQVVFDAHGESMHRPAEHYQHEDSKFFFDMRIHPNEDHFYLAEIATSEKGWRDEWERRRTYYHKDGGIVDTNLLKIDDEDRLEFVFNRRTQILRRNTMKFGLQFGKIFSDIAVRFGLFENTGGVAVDFDIPFRSEKFRWVTSLEIYDIAGWNRVNDRRPHLKWLNRMFILRNIYFTFGADDFASRHNASTFLGFGVRFGDDDIKYFLPSLGGARSLA